MNSFTKTVLKTLLTSGSHTMYLLVGVTDTEGVLHPEETSVYFTSLCFALIMWY